LKFSRAVRRVASTDSLNVFSESSPSAHDGLITAWQDHLDGWTSRVMPGLGYFGHRLFECERCGKAKVIPAPSNSEIALCPTIILT
jgi:hypothetical protein